MGCLKLESPNFFIEIRTFFMLCFDGEVLVVGSGEGVLIVNPRYRVICNNFVHALSKSNFSNDSFLQD